MRFIHRFFIVLICSLLLNCKGKVADKNKLSNYSAQKSWKKLFNGKDLED
jgi:hypothetical protein